MYNSILKKVSRVTAYVAGGILIFLGVMGALVELSGGNSSFTHLFGYLVAAVLVACGVLICVSVRRFAERANDGVRLVTAYIAGGTLILLGIIVSLAEFSKAKPFTTHFLGHVLAAVAVPRQGSGRPKKNPVRVIADRAYDSDPLRQRLQRRGLLLIVPHRKNRKRPS